MITSLPHTVCESTCSVAGINTFRTFIAAFTAFCSTSYCKTLLSSKNGKQTWSHLHEYHNEALSTGLLATKTLMSKLGSQAYYQTKGKLETRNWRPNWCQPTANPSLPVTEEDCTFLDILAWFLELTNIPTGDYLPLDIVFFNGALLPWTRYSRDRFSRCRFYFMSSWNHARTVHLHKTKVQHYDEQ